MTDPYRLSEPRMPARRPPSLARAAAVRRLLCTLLVIGLAGNTVVSFGHASTAVHLALGGVAVLSLAALVARNPRRRR